jgi:hypothetical protein
MGSRLPGVLLSASLCLLLGACIPLSQLFSVTPPERIADRQEHAIVPRMQAIIEPELRDNLNNSLPAVRAALADQTHKIAKFKESLTLRALADPWAGMSTVEQAGLLAAGYVVNLILWPQQPLLGSNVLHTIGVAVLVAALVCPWLERPHRRYALAAAGVVLFASFVLCFESISVWVEPPLSLQYSPSE